MLYQLFVESKGGHLFKTDEWKQQFLLSINEEFKLKSLHEDEYMRLIGMPFYNESRKTEFRDKFNDILKIGLNK
jgi:type III restriction enzyme